MSDDNPDSHSEGAVNDKFCSIRSDNCSCGNRYKKPCKSEAKAWTAIEPDWKYPKKVGDRVQKWGHQAHHTLCVASVTGEITTKAAIDPVVKKTEWCVNAEPNMIALPVWPMTIDWYVSFSKQGAQVAMQHRTRQQAGTPPFAGLAQHDYDHDKYNTQVNTRLQEVAANITASKKKHEEAVGDLLSELKSALDDFKPELQGRKTDEAWYDGMGGEESWWQPFSMVGAAGVKRAFPAPNNDNFKLTFEKLVEAYGG